MFNRKIYVDHLKAVPLFRSCTEKDLKELARHTEQVTVSAGSTVVEEGQNGREFFVIASGQAEITRGGRHVVTIGEGACFGELGLLVDQPRNATVTAVGDLDLVVLNRPDFTAAISDIPGLGLKLAQGLAARVAELDAAAVS